MTNKEPTLSPLIAIMNSVNAEIRTPAKSRMRTQRMACPTTHISDMANRTDSLCDMRILSTPPSLSQNRNKMLETNARVARLRRANIAQSKQTLGASEFPTSSLMATFTTRIKKEPTA